MNHTDKMKMYFGSDKLYGIDISQHQGDINFKKVKDDGVDFVILRAAYGTVLDKKFMEYVTKAQEAGLLIFGIYIFSYATNLQEAKAEALNAISLLRTTGLDKSVVIYYDFEYDTVEYAKNRSGKNIILGPKECREMTSVFTDAIADNGYIPGIYTNIDYSRRMYSLSYLDERQDKGAIIWLAKWVSTLENPTVESLVDFSEYDMMQYSSTEKIYGINGNVDVNMCIKHTMPDLSIPETIVPNINYDLSYDSDQLLTFIAALEVIVGAHGNGDERKNKLGDKYDKIQKVVKYILEYNEDK